MEFVLSAGVALGLSAGFSPGPLSALVISHSLRHGMREGFKVAMAPFFTDLPIVLLSVFALSQLRDSQVALGLISLLGAAVLVYFAIESFKVKAVNVDAGDAQARSLGRGALVNFLSPNPYLFWLTVGAPRVVEAWTLSPWMAMAFLGGFYVCLVGGKMSLAVLAARARPFLTGKGYRYVMSVLGGVLMLLAFLFLRDGLVFLRVL